MMNDRVFTESYDKKSFEEMNAKAGHNEYFQPDMEEKKKVQKYKILFSFNKKLFSYYLNLVQLSKFF